jgi:hypothetical protein
MNTAIKTNSRTNLILRITHILAWVIFIGICIRTGAILYSFFVSMVMNPAAAKNLHLGLNLSVLYGFSTKYYSMVVLLIIAVSVLKAYIFYLVIKIFSTINFVHPFSREVSVLVSKISYIALLTGLLTLLANSYCEWLIKSGATLPDLVQYLGAGSEFIFFAGIIFFIAQVFKRGIEIQSENELTV